MFQNSLNLPGDLVIFNTEYVLAVVKKDLFINQRKSCHFA